jgi:hypothetical protein
MKVVLVLQTWRTSGALLGILGPSTRWVLPTGDLLQRSARFPVLHASMPVH